MKGHISTKLWISSPLSITSLAVLNYARIISVNEIELETEIAFTVYPHEKSQIKIIGEIKALGEKKKNSCALSVYIPVEGEELWSLSKRLNVCPSALLSTNPELTFPLTGKERIVVYRQK